MSSGFARDFVHGTASRGGLLGLVRHRVGLAVLVL